MGCGQSSLKGEKKEDITEPPQPIKKVATNFSTVNYDSATAGAGRRNTEYAPHDDIRHKPSEALSPLTEKEVNPLSIDGATQPGTTTTAIPGATELPSQTSQNPVGAEIPSKTEPYRDVTASPTTPTAHNVVTAFPESQPTAAAATTTTKPTQ